MSTSFPELLVSYHVRSEEPREAVRQLEAYQSLAPTFTTVAGKKDFRSRIKLLRLKAMLATADDDFRHRRYDDALAGYQRSSTLILGLLSPMFDAIRGTLTFPGPGLIATPLVQAVSGMLATLLPDDDEPPLIHTDLEIDPTALGADTLPLVVAGSPAPQRVLDLTDAANVAIERGDWPDASAQLTNALSVVRGNDSQAASLRADILLNLGSVEIQRNRTRIGLEHLGRAIKMFEEADDKIGLAEALHNTGMAHLRAGRTKAADAVLAASRKAARGATLTRPPRSTSPARGEDDLSGPADEIAPSIGPVLGAPLPGARVRATGAAPRVSAKSADVVSRANSLGTDDRMLHFRALRPGEDPPRVRIEMPAQRRLEEFDRNLTVSAGEATAQLSWSRTKGPTRNALLGVYRGRVAATNVKVLAPRIDTIAETAVNLPHLYHLALAIKMGDCHHHLGEFENAQAQYRRAAEYQFINAHLEAPDLWRRIAENQLAWGDSLYRTGETQAAMPIYEAVMTPEQTGSGSFLYSTQSLRATGNRVSNWLDAIAAGIAPPQLNPALTTILHTVRVRWQFIAAGLDFFGSPAQDISPFTFKHLLEIARYFANRAIQTEQRFIDFFTRYEQGTMTRQEMENASDLADLEVDAAKDRERAADELVDAMAAGVALADLRHGNAQDMLDRFNSTAWEAEQLAGHIARGSAWTGGDLPNLHYSAGGAYDFEGKKHEVLQDLARRQTQISNGLQRERLENQRAELNAARDVARAQRDVAEARRDAARSETRVAEARSDHAQEMIAAFNSQVFDPEQWLQMSLVMRGLSQTALDRGIETARLMQRVYNFEHVANRGAIRSSYQVGGSLGLLGGERLLSDIESFLHHRITTVRRKPIPVRWEISLADEFPGPFNILLPETGRMEFDIDLDRVRLANPGTYRHLLTGMEVVALGFLPPNGLGGRIKNSGLGRYRDDNGNVTLRVQPAETLVLSRFEPRRDGALLTPDPDMRQLFEGNSAASGWTLELPRSANDSDPRGLFDINLVLYFECLFDEQLFAIDTQPPVGFELERSRAVHLRFNFPDAYYSLLDTGAATLDLDATDFPFNQTNPRLRTLALAMPPVSGAVTDGIQLDLTYPGSGGTRAVTIASGGTVVASNLPVAGAPPALGSYGVAINAADLDRRSELSDLILIIEYTFTPASA